MNDNRRINPREIEELMIARSLLRAIKSGVGIVDKTFYRNPDPAYFTKEATATVVGTMKASIAMFEARYGSLD